MNEDITSALIKQASIAIAMISLEYQLSFLQSTFVRMSEEK